MANESNELKIGFIGAGKVALALGSSLRNIGYSISSISSRSYQSALSVASQISGCTAVKTADEVVHDCNLVFITTPDAAIGRVCESVSWRPGQMAAHTSGADSRSVLDSASSQGALTGVFHPLATVSPNGGALEPFCGITITIEAEPPLLETLEGLARSLGADTLRLHEENRSLYHASAVFVSNYVMALADIATGLWQEMGFEKQQAEKALLPLLKGSVHNLDTVGLPACLTGPVSRGDTGTIKKHLDSLEKLDDSLSITYRALGLHTINIARRKGSITPKQAEDITSILNTWERSYD